MVNSLAIIEDLYKTMHSVLISKSSARRFKQYSETIQSEAAIFESWIQLGYGNSF